MVNVAFVTEYPQFFAATIVEWQRLLEQDRYKDIKHFAFVIMSNHIHLIWQMQPLIKPGDVQRDFLKYTAQKFKFDLQKNNDGALNHFESGANDRLYQFWKRRSLSIELRTDKVFQQKLNYIHSNPVKAGICQLPETYKYPSALFYHTDYDNWSFLTHYKD